MGAVNSPAPGDCKITVLFWRSIDATTSAFLKLEKVGSHFLTPVQVTGVTEKGKYPVVLAGSEGSILVSWKNDSNLEWQVFGGNGEPLDKVFSKPSSNNTRHAGATTRHGDFLLID